jgi:exodeoxyribonuclease VII large subunit
MPNSDRPKEIYSVSRLNRTVRGLLEDVFQQVWVEGEISNLRRISSGHWYFTLKDAQAQVSCAMFRGQNRLLRFSPRDGMQVLVRGRVGLYEARGNYQVVVEYMEEGGEGALLRAYEELKQRLDREGLFDDDHKRPLPSLPPRIGVITSASGAALRDVLSVLRRRFPAIPVLVYPSAVQGRDAPAQLRAALTRALQRQECDVLLLTRGGGSLEDLWAFNDEALARLIYAADIPIVSAVGHEIDFTIADFVADRRAPTPSAAAELLSPDQQGIITALQRYRQRIAVAMQRGVDQRNRHLLTLEQRLQRAHPGRRLEAASQRLDELSERLQRLIRQRFQESRRRLDTLQGRLRQQDPGRRLQQIDEHCNGLEQRLRSALLSGMERRRFRLEKAMATLQVVSPLATLERGYAIVTHDQDDKLLQRADQVEVGDRISARLAHGQLQCRVERRIVDLS